MRKYPYNMNNYPLEEINQNTNNNSVNNYITFASKKNGPMYIGPAAQASLLKNLMDVLEILSRSKKQFDFIKNGLKFKSFEKYLKYFSSSDYKTKLKLIKTLYKSLFNEKNPPELKGVLPENMIFVLNLRTLNEICDYILFSLFCLYNTKNVDNKLTELIKGNMSWREACTKKNYLNSEEFSKFEKSMKYLDTLNCFSCFNVEFTKNLKEEQNIVFENILLFCVFYEALFKNCPKINIDMTLPKLDEIYSSSFLRNKLKQLDEKNIISNINSTYLKGLLVNYLIMKCIGDHFKEREGLLLSLQQYESYIIEIFSLFQNEVLEIKDKEIENFACTYKNCNFLFYSAMYYLSPKTGFKLDLNVLDPLLFKNIIYTIFIILSNGEPIQDVEISLFPKENLKINIDINKIYLNHVIFNNLKKYISDDLKEINFDYLNHNKFNWKNKDSNDIIDTSPDKIYDILFEDFNTNLFYLLVLIDKNSQTLSETIKINLPQNLLTKKKYIHSISYFIYNVFNFLLKKKLSINMSQFKLVTNIQIPDSICRFQKIGLTNLKINNLKLKINNISNILDFNLLPYSTCSQISLSNISYADFNNLILSLKNYISNEESPPSTLKHLKIKFGNTLFNNFNIIDDMLRNYNLPKTISYLTFRIKNELSTNEYFELMWKVINSIACAENTPKNLTVKVKLYYDEKEDQVYFNYLKTNLESCFDYEKLNPDFLITYKFNFKKNKENEEIIVELNKYKRTTRMDAFIKIANAFDKNQKVEMKYKMPTCLKIIRFINKFDTESDVKIHFIFVKSI